MAKRPGTTLSAKKLREVLAAEPRPPQGLPSEYSGRMSLLADGRVLIVFEDGAGVVYPSREAYDELMRFAERQAAKGPQDPKLELLPPAAEFLANVAERAAQVPLDLGLALSDGEQDFEAIDKAVLVLQKRARLAPALVTWLVAYVGEYMRRKTCGQWTTVDAGGSPEPVVVTPKGRMLQPFAVVYLELIRGTKGSIRGALRGAMVGL